MRNLRVAGAGELQIGRRTEAFTATELADDAKLPILREYLRKWGWEVGQFFEGISKSSTDEQLSTMAAGFPAFRIDSVRASGR